MNTHNRTNEFEDERARQIAHLKQIAKENGCSNCWLKHDPDNAPCCNCRHESDHNTKSYWVPNQRALVAMQAIAYFGGGES